MSHGVPKALALPHDGGLKLSLDGKELAHAEYLKRSQAQSAPSLTLTNPDADAKNKTYLALCIDIDAPYKSMPFLGPILHWIQPDLRIQPSSTGTLTTDAPPLVNYIAPAPPPGAAPHRYLFVVYEQPGNWDEQKWEKVYQPPVANTKRMFWSLEKFEERAGAKGRMVAAAWFESN